MMRLRLRAAELPRASSIHWAAQFLAEVSAFFAHQQQARKKHGMTSTENEKLRHQKVIHPPYREL
jgi:hypothetical protein